MNTTKRPGLDSLVTTVVTWQEVHGRHHLPWQGTNDPYRIWLSEIMLQQTQVTTVIGYYERFLTQFPDVTALAAASLDEVMPYWSGLGYYARARNLHRCAQTIITDYDGQFPTKAEQLATLPGIGRSTAAAIAAFSVGEAVPIMDGNVKRVFTRHFGIAGSPARRATEKELWDVAEQAIALTGDTLDIRAYTQGLMDLGATICTRSRPACDHCPLHGTCYAKKHALQHAFPERAIKKTPPKRQCAMLVLQQGQQVLLQRQPAPGIWGGLWSLPRYDDRTELDTELVNQGINLRDLRKLPVVQHAFSHFRLEIQAWHLVADHGSAHLSEPDPGHAWVDIGALNSAALPAPVKSLLKTLFN